MGQLKWYKRDPDAALSGMMGLSLEERGAYNTVLDLIYTRDGNLPDDDRFVSGWLGVDVRVWRRIKNRLLDLDKLYLEAGFLRNRRADVEVDAALSRVGSARDAGKASAISKQRKSKAKTPKNNDIASTDVETETQRPFQLTTTTTRDIEASPLANSRSTDEQGGVSEDIPARPKITSAEIDTAIEQWTVSASKRGWPVPRALTDARRKKLAARLRTHGADGWKLALTKAWQSPLLSSDPPPSWFNFDWITKNDENLLKVLEGNYDRGRDEQGGLFGRNAAPAPRPQRDRSPDELAAARQRLAEREGIHIPATATGAPQ